MLALVHVLSLTQSTPSCATYGCVGYTPANTCQCNPSCAKHNSCCDDVLSVCVSPPPPPRPPHAPGACVTNDWKYKEIPCSFPTPAHPDGTCKALVDLGKAVADGEIESQTCDDYCEDVIGMVCVAVFEDKSDSCNVKDDAGFECDTDLSSVTSDAICECGDADTAKKSKATLTSLDKKMAKVAKKLRALHK